MRVLCVAEKPSISKAIAQILSGGQLTMRPSRSKFVKNYDFDYPQTRAQFTVTCVSGHLNTHDFPETHRKWNSCDPLVLFDLPVQTFISKDSKDIETNLLAEARRADMLMIWTDCDREGEHIGLEIKRVCRRAKANIVVKRARFSAIIAQFTMLLNTPSSWTKHKQTAVEARIILDLRIGAAFTRMQTQTLQNSIAQVENVVSYGPCQFPTLGFVVQRYLQVKNFVPEPFWYIFLSLSRPSDSSQGTIETEFKWRRVHLFDHDAAAVIYEHVMSNPIAANHEETDQFDPQFDFMTLIQKQTVDPAWGGFAQGLQQGGFNTPRRGKNNDKAHPPIHPTAHAGGLNGDEKRVYEVRHAPVPCLLFQGRRGFDDDRRCLVVHQRNYLDVYPYDKWTGNRVPVFAEGEQFDPTVCELREGSTTSPKYLTEADLGHVDGQERDRQAPDATIAQHIETVVHREYVLEEFEGGTKYLKPSTLGIGLVEGYDEMGFERSLSKPHLRRETERSMVQVCNGAKSKQDMLEESIEQYRAMFVLARGQFNRVTTVRSSLSLRHEVAHHGIRVCGGTSMVLLILTAGAGQEAEAVGAAVVLVVVQAGVVAGLAVDAVEVGPEEEAVEVVIRLDQGPEVAEPHPEVGEDHPLVVEVLLLCIDHRVLRHLIPTRKTISMLPHLRHLQSDKPLLFLYGNPRQPRAAPSMASSAICAATVLTCAALKAHCDAFNGRRRNSMQLQCTCGPKERKFWTCETKLCQFFKWVEDLPVASGSRSIPAKRSYSGRQDTVDDGAGSTRKCKCDLAAVQRTVVKEVTEPGAKVLEVPESARDGMRVL
ncbi:DNA topoisomerase [Mycena metata]|uniref:DNA topoisomerase n=1 Tax=Mycena metata TaxID=1033252 RepID=A0AAD7MLV7_9AGAR|nr:DNA topoisomerase [Mycena metata]